jgi:hypothetical protein
VAGLHWLASRKSAFIFEYSVEETPIRTQLAKQDLKATDDVITVPEEACLQIRPSYLEPLAGTYS